MPISVSVSLCEMPWVDLLTYLFIRYLVSGRQCVLGFLKKLIPVLRNNNNPIMFSAFLYCIGSFKNVILSLLYLLMNEIS